MTSARLRIGFYEVLGTSSGCVVIRVDTGENWPFWALYSDGVFIDSFATKCAALVLCQEHPEL